MSRCPTDHEPLTVVYDVNGWRQWCSRCGALLVEDYLPRARRRPGLAAVKTLCGLGAGLVLLGLTAGTAVLIVYLISLLAP